MDIGQKIKAARKVSGLTQDQLAQKSGVATITIRQYETGKRQPRLEQLQKIADALDVSIFDLMGVEEKDGLVSFPIPPELADRIGLNASNSELLGGELVPGSEAANAIMDYLFGSKSSKEQQEASKIIDHVKESLSNSQSFRKMSYAEAYRVGLLKFNSDEDRTVFFYDHLNDAGKIAAGGCFYQHLSQDVMKEVADYVTNLYENPLYQRQDPPEASQEALEDKK